MGSWILLSENELKRNPAAQTCKTSHRHHLRTFEKTAMLGSEQLRACLYDNVILSQSGASTGKRYCYIYVPISRASLLTSRYSQPKVRSRGWNYTNGITCTA